MYTPGLFLLNCAQQGRGFEFAAYVVGRFIGGRGGFVSIGSSLLDFYLSPCTQCSTSARCGAGGARYSLFASAVRLPWTRNSGRATIWPLTVGDRAYQIIGICIASSNGKSGAPRAPRIFHYHRHCYTYRSLSPEVHVELNHDRRLCIVQKSSDI